MKNLAPLLLALVVGGSFAHADAVLHEFVPDVAAEEGDLVGAGKRGDEPFALMYEGEVLPPPVGGALEPDEKPLTAEPAPPGGPSFRPDRLTELEDTLGYYAVFTPSIAPFKRVTALDAVRIDADGKTPVLFTEPRGTRALRVEGAEVPPPDARPRERFWGSVVLDFREGRRAPLPSVSPESRILTARTEPETALRFEKGEGDAFFAVAVGAVPPEPVRLVFLTDAPRTYFGTSLPEVAADTLSHEVQTMPASVKARALAFASELGVSPSDPLPEVLAVLVAHFRSFEESSVPPDDRGDIYLDLARSKKGVCRHRTYAFVITAQALGIPSRFVYNEAHSFTEVKMPGVGWMRIDLGGAARALEAHGAEDRPVHRPAEPDPLPRPEAYEASYSQLAGNVSGFRSDEVPASSSSSPSSAGAASPGNEAPSTTRSSRRSSPGTSTVSEAGGPRSEDEPGPDIEDEPAPIPLRISVEQRRYEAYRGRSLEVSGRVVDDAGEGVRGLRVEVILRRGAERLLGVTVSGEHGWFHSTFGVPPHLAVGDYDLVVRTPGDDTYAPAAAF